jgi:hypothetical protein
MMETKSQKLCDVSLEHPVQWWKSSLFRAAYWVLSREGGAGLQACGKAASENGFSR